VLRERRSRVIAVIGTNGDTFLLKIDLLTAL